MLWKRNHFHQHQHHLYQCSLTSHSSSTIMSSLMPSISVEMILEEWTSLHHITNQLRSHLIPILFVWNVEDSFAEERYRSSWNTMRGVMVDKMLTLSHTHVYKYTHTPVHIRYRMRMFVQFQHSSQYGRSTVHRIENDRVHYCMRVWVCGTYSVTELKIISIFFIVFYSFFSIFGRNLCDSFTQIELFNCTKIFCHLRCLLYSWRESL